ncbi:MAG: hypothetical protein JSU04_19690 [Bdellovibrionales bacterium]|nr:hypothetical protein [Bdellovibrionales bacterium]
MNYRILLLTAMLAVSMQACQGGKSNEKAARANGAAAGGDANKTSPGAGKSADGDTAAQKTSALNLKGDCTNPIEMTVQPGEKEIQLKDLVTGKDGSYQLISTELFTAIQSDKDTANNLHFLGSEITADDNLKEESTSDDKIEVVCATKAKEGQDLRLTGSLDVPNAFDTKDGAVRIYRHDGMQIENGKETPLSVVLPKTAKIGDTQEKKPEGLKLLVVKKDNSDVTIKMQYETVDRQQKHMSAIIAATYRLKK